jgi:hypothetical protein
VICNGGLYEKFRFKGGGSYEKSFEKEFEETFEENF